MTDNKCARNCTKEMDVYAAGADTSAINKCLCITGYKWDAVAAKCVKSVLAAGFAYFYEPLIQDA